MSWHYLDTFAMLANERRAVVLYDQLGAGATTPRGAEIANDISLDILLLQLDAIITQLGVAHNHVLLGHSSGGVLATEYALANSNLPRALILANAYASVDLFLSSVRRKRQLLPSDMSSIMDAHEAAGTTDSTQYRAAEAEFIRNFVCRCEPSPGLLETFSELAQKPYIFQALWGESVHRCTGRYRGWSAVARMDMLSLPTLVYHGSYDEADEACSQPFVSEIPDVTYKIIPDSSHCSHIENTDRCLKEISDFLSALG